MFYDERIERAKGRISRNAVILSVIISAVLGAIRLTNILKNTAQSKYLCLVILEAVIIFGGSICLLIGFTRSKLQPRDERAIFVESCFYNKAASVLIKTVTIVFAVFLPIVLHIGLPNHYTDGEFDRILLVLSFVVGIYVIYGFRRNDIYFNYSIMENEHYYKSVFKNIGKLAIYILCLFAVSATSFALFVAAKELDQVILIKYSLQIVGLYLIALLELSLLYLLYSFLEKTSYDSTRRLSKSTAVSLGITVFLYAVYTFTAILADSSAVSQAQAMQTVSAASSLAGYIDFALLIFLTYFSYEYLKVKHNKLLSAACLTILLNETSAFLIGRVWSGMTSLFLREMIEYDAYTITYFLSAAKTVLQDLSNIANLIGFSLMILALIKDKAIGKSNLAAIICLAALGGIEMFLRTQTGYLEVNIYHSLAEIAVLIYLCVLVACIEKRGKIPVCRDVAKPL